MTDEVVVLPIEYAFISYAAVGKLFDCKQKIYNILASNTRQTQLESHWWNIQFMFM